MLFADAEALCKFLLFSDAKALCKLPRINVVCQWPGLGLSLTRLWLWDVVSQGLVAGSGLAWLSLGLGLGLKREHKKHIMDVIEMYLFTIQVPTLCLYVLMLLLDWKTRSFWTSINKWWLVDILAPLVPHLLVPQDWNVSLFILCLPFFDAKLFPFCHLDQFISQPQSLGFWAWLMLEK